MNFNDFNCSPHPGCNYLIPGVNLTAAWAFNLMDGVGAAHWNGLAAGRKPNTAIRAGYAIFHDSAWNQGAQGLWQNPPYFAETDNFSGLCPFGNTTQDCVLTRASFQPLHRLRIPLITLETITQNLNFKQGMIQQYNLNVEYQIPGDMVLTIGYAGSHSTHILQVKETQMYDPVGVPRRSRLYAGLRPRRNSLCGAVGGDIATTTSAAPVTTLYRSKQRLRAHGTVCTLLSVIPMPRLSIVEFPTDWALILVHLLAFARKQWY